MEAEGESQLPEANGEVEEPRENEGTRGGGAEETMEESTEERETDLEDSDEEEEEEESSGKKNKINSKCSTNVYTAYIKRETQCNRRHLKLFSFFSLSYEEMDDEDCERRRGECLDEMMDLEKQFQELKEK